MREVQVVRIQTPIVTSVRIEASGNGLLVFTRMVRSGDPILPDLNQHLVILGCTNSGKTFLAKHLYEHSGRLNVFFNVQGEDVSGKLLERAPTMRELVKYRHVNWAASPDSMIQDLPAFVDKLFALGRKLGEPSYNRSHPWCNVFIDEAHLVEPKHAAMSALSMLVLQGMRHGVICISVSQRPALISHTALTQSSRVILFRINEPERAYLAQNVAPIGELDWAWIQQPYHSIMLEQAHWIRIPPIRYNTSRPA